MTFELTADVRVDSDDDGNVWHLEHLQQPVVAIAPGREGFAENAAAAGGAPTVAAATPQALAEQYLREVAPIYGLDDAMLPGVTNGAFSGDGAAPEQAPDGRLELAEEKEIMGTTVVSYQQTYDGLPVWEAGVSVTMLDAPLRVTASQSSVHTGVAVSTGTPGAAPAITPGVLRAALGLGEEATPTINGTPRHLIYAYDPGNRFDPESATDTRSALEEPPPTLPLPALPAGLVAGQHYIVTEVLFTYELPGYGPLHWRAFLEQDSGAVVYLRAFIACATGMVFRTDPLTAGAAPAVTPTSPAAVLNPFRSTVPLQGLATADPQPLSGAFVTLVDTEVPVATPPTAPNPPASFVYDAPAREFAAVNAYHHCDFLFRNLQGMGFTIATYFDGTKFPVPVDACGFQDQRNARAPGNITGTGSGGFLFGLAGTPFPAVSIAADLRVVLHEFGHTLLWDSVHSPNFGFAHSAGDSLAAVLLDPESSLRSNPVRRFETFPWILPDRNHGRDIAAGWAWGGVRDVGGYSSEQILSTTHFRLYRSLGGDSAQVVHRKLAARQTVYLIFRAIGSLATNPVTPTPRPDVFATALMNADIGTANFEGYRGGTFHKVVRWAFEKQGLFQPPGAPKPVTTPGAPPAVDVYIDDGRAGEYPHQPVHWQCTEIWNRLTPDPGGGPGAHQTPVVGKINHAFVRVRNRGTQPANGVVVRGYSAAPGVGLSWPGDWTPMHTPQLAVPAAIPSGGAVIVGPFAWKPKVAGHECMFMEVSAPGDRSNIDPATLFPCASGPTAEWRLVPFDNNLGQRNVCPVPGGGGRVGLLTGFVGRSFTVHNPYDRRVRIVVKGTLPPVLATRGWGMLLSGSLNETAFDLAPGAHRQVRIILRPGQQFTAADVEAAKDRAIQVLVLAENVVLGGMTYVLDPHLTRAPAELDGVEPVPLDHPEITELLESAPPADQEGLTDLVEAEPSSVVADAPASSGRAERVVGDAARLLAGIDLTDALSSRAQRVTVREVTIDITLD